jgi:glycosyltransferase involved in cell wall biosynthesis
MNLCICTDLSLKENNGGVDRITNLAKNASKNGVNVYLVDRSLRRSFFSLFFDGDRYYEFINGTAREHDYPLRCRFLFPGLTKLLQEIFNRIICLLTFSFSQAVCLSYVIDPYLFVKLFFVCKRERIDLIQCEFHVTVPSSFVAKKLLNIPIIYDAHNIETEIIGDIPNISSTYIAATKLVEKMSCFVCDLIFVVSEKDREQLASLGIPRNKIEVIPNSVDVNKFSPTINGDKIRDQYRLHGRIVLIFHGPLGYPPNEEAALMLTEKVLPSVLKRHPNVSLLLVGRNPPRIFHPNIIITGFVKDLPEFIAASDIGVVPLLRGGGTRIKLLEYMACGKPVVSTMKGAEGLDLKNGHDILMSKYPDSQFIDLIFEMIEDDKLRKRMGLNARKKIESYYNWETTAKRAVQVYKTILQI